MPTTRNTSRCRDWLLPWAFLPGRHGRGRGKPCAAAISQIQFPHRLTSFWGLSALYNWRLASDGQGAPGHLALLKRVNRLKIAVISSTRALITLQTKLCQSLSPPEHPRQSSFRLSQTVPTLKYMAAWFPTGPPPPSHNERTILVVTTTRLDALTASQSGAWSKGYLDRFPFLVGPDPPATRFVLQALAASKARGTFDCFSTPSY